MARERARQNAAARLIQTRLLRERDPISLQAIRRRFRLLRNGTHILYDAFTLHAYIEASGDLRDPVCRQEYALHELMRLSRVCDRPLVEMTRRRRQHEDEVRRRDMVSYLCNEIMNSDLLPTEALFNLHQIATETELMAAYANFRTHGIFVYPEAYDVASILEWLTETE